MLNQGPDGPDRPDSVLLDADVGYFGLRCSFGGLSLWNMEQDDTSLPRKRFLTHPNLQKIPSKTRRRMRQAIAERENSSNSDGSDDSNNDQSRVEAGSDNQSESDNFKESSSSSVDNVRVYHPLRGRQITEGVQPDDLPSSSDDESFTACNLEEDASSDPGPENEEQAPPSPPPPHQRLVDLLQGSYSEQITIRVTATRGELLQMALSHRHQNRLTNKAFKDSVNLLNSAFASPVIPDTVHLIDNLLYDDSVLGIERHFFCDKCHNYFGLIDHTAAQNMQCPNVLCGKNNFVGNLTEARYFVLFDIVPQLQLLLEEDGNILKLMSPKDCIRDDDNGDLNDITDGLLYQIFAKSLNDDGHVVLTITVNTDGAPSFTCGRISLWPLFLIVNELPPLVRIKNVILAGLWFGRDTPSMDLFLQKFVARFSHLSDGFQMTVNGVVNSFKLLIIGATVDSGIRGAVQGIKAHGGYCSCNWCETVGVWDQDSVKYPNEIPEPRLRTHDSLREYALKAINREYPRGLSDRDKAIALKGVFGLSSLDGLQSFDNVQGFIVEYMHAVLLGVVRRMLCVWKDGVIGADDLANVEDNIKYKLSPPVELRRRLRPIEDWKEWKARDFENFLLSFSVPLLHNVLPRRKINHFVLLVQAVYFLLKRTVKEHEIILAEKLLLLYVSDVEDIYGLREMTFNVHLLTHLARNCALWGGLWTSSAFPFENAIGQLKEIIHSAGGIAHQVCRVISERHAAKLLKVHCSSAKTNQYLSTLKKQPVKKGITVGPCHYFGVASHFDPTPDERWLCEQYEIEPLNCFVYGKIIKDKCLYVSSRRKNTDNTVPTQKIDVYGSR
ncbi:hypothetical protein ONE63_006697 [Megalurothrips usitatus]|uniref:Transposase domain-containing protein n=1 Tax=Megalurothrips usitatus TaxID=439358 RepID=A0AAV7XU62_9NEOP|nr:hypothetical protein ONE63_006697 [Megalurothrips usitatus]